MGSASSCRTAIVQLVSLQPAWLLAAVGTIRSLKSSEYCLDLGRAYTSLSAALDAQRQMADRSNPREAIILAAQRILENTQERQEEDDREEEAEIAASESGLLLHSMWNRN